MLRTCSKYSKNVTSRFFQPTTSVDFRRSHMTEAEWSEKIRILHEQTRKYENITTQLHDLKKEMLEMKTSIQKIENSLLTEKEIFKILTKIVKAW